MEYMRQERCKKSRRRIFEVLAACCVLLAVFALYAVLTRLPAHTPEAMSRFVAKRGNALLDAVKDRPEGYYRLDFWWLAGKEITADTRGDDGQIRFTLPWDTYGEEGYELVYSENGSVRKLEYTFTGTGRVDGIFVLGRGYIDCTQLDPHWFFLEWYLPT